MDRGLATVITLVSGLAVSIAQACSGDDVHPPVTSQIGNAPRPDVGAGTGTGPGATPIGASADGGADSGDAGDAGDAGADGGDGGDAGDAGDGAP